MDPNRYLLEVLRERLAKQGYIVVVSPTENSLNVASTLDIATRIIYSPDYHPSLIHLEIVTKHTEYFPEGILENIVGTGTDIKAKVNTVLDNYLSTTFPAITDAFLDGHDPEFDFTGDNGILYHPRLGALSLQGKWQEEPAGEPVFDLLKKKLQHALPNKKMNWLKVYIARYQDNEIIGECLLNNEPWAAGLQEVQRYAGNWPQQGTFLGQKQFMMFRRCDEFDGK